MIEQLVGLLWDAKDKAQRYNNAQCIVHDYNNRYMFKIITKEDAKHDDTPIDFAIVVEPDGSVSIEDMMIWD